MNNNQKNIVKDLLEDSKKINSKAFTLTRYLLLLLILFYKDGLQYRELKTLLNISDGKLKSNLDFLQELGYIKKIKIRLDQKDMHIYMTTDLGNKELKKIFKWIDKSKRIEVK